MILSTLKKLLQRVFKLGYGRTEGFTTTRTNFMTPDELTLTKIYHIGEAYLSLAYYNFSSSISNVVECLKKCFSGSYLKKLKKAIASKDAKAAFFAAKELDNYTRYLGLITFERSLENLIKDLAPLEYNVSAENDGYGTIAWTSNTQALFEKVEANYIVIEELVKQLDKKTAKTNFTELEAEIEYEERKKQEKHERWCKQDRTLTKIFSIDGYYAQACENIRSVDRIVEYLKTYFSGSYFEKLKNAIASKDAKAAFFAAKELDNYAYGLCLKKLDNSLDELADDLAPLGHTKNAENDGYGPIAWTANTQALFEKVEANYIVIEELVKQLE